MLYLEQPADFHPTLAVAGCFVVYDNEILLLHRQDDRPQGATWGIPSGSIEPNEQPVAAMVRELQEETGYRIPSPNIRSFATAYVRYPTYDFVYHMFHTRVAAKQPVVLNAREHTEAIWMAPDAAVTSLPLIKDLDACIRIFKARTMENG